MHFHRHTGSLVILSNDGKTAKRNHSSQEFNNGVVITAEKLATNQLFEVKIDRKLNSWSGSIEIGVTSCDPNQLELPTSATGFREGTWTMSGTSIMHDGHTIIEEYGADLDHLAEGDRVGVMRCSNGALHFFVNGSDQGMAVSEVPMDIHVVVDLYGKCAQISIVEDIGREQAIFNEMSNEAIAEASSTSLSAQSQERLCFHEKCGNLVKLSTMRRTAERRKPLDEFNNGVVMTNRHLEDDEMFEIRLDQLVDKWSGSIEVGVTTHNPSSLEFPATMTNMRSGTIMMSGCGILTNGKGTRREYGEFNLDELNEGDRIGMMRKSNGALHYYINDIDQGVAATHTPQQVWGVVDLYGMAVKVTIVDHTSQSTVLPTYSEDNMSINNRTNNYIQRMHAYDCEEGNDDHDRLLFHPQCGLHAAVINGQQSAHRPNAVDDFNNGVVLTNRHLRSNEMFEVCLDKMVDKWAGSIEIGVTTHCPVSLDFPSTMTNMRSGTWMMTGNGVMHNGTNVIDDYGQNLDRLKVGDRVGVIRKDDGSLYFFVNGINQGLAASNVPENVYGVIDLYGQAAQATIMDQAEALSIPSVEIKIDGVNADDLYFHYHHGNNAIITNGGKTACRPRAREEFNDAIVMSNRPLRDNELFEVSLDKMVDRWSGSIEAGVTLILPHELEFPNTMTDIDHDTWMLSGSAIMQDGSTIGNGYRLDLDTLSANSRIGMMRCSDGTLHYYESGVDMGVACTDIPSGVYAVIDLYGQCAQVTITSGVGYRPNENHVSTTELEPSISSPLTAEMTHRFSQCCGRNVTLKNNNVTACRMHGFDNGLIFSIDPLRTDELFEVRIDQVSRQWSGTLKLGLTSMAVSESTLPSVIPKVATQLKAKATTWIVAGSKVLKNGTCLKENYAPCLERLKIGDRMGIKRGSDATMHILFNGEDLGIAATHIPKNVFAVIDLFGPVDTVTIVSSAYADVFNSSRPPSVLSLVGNSVEEEQDEDTTEMANKEFHSSHGKNIELSNKNLTARRCASYNQGVVMTRKPLERNKPFKIRLDSLNTRWTSSLAIGVITVNPEKLMPPLSGICLKKPSWVIYGNSVFQNGLKVKDNYGPNLDTLRVGHTVGVLVDNDGALHLLVNDIDQGCAARDIPLTCYAMVDLYGQCEQISILNKTDNTTYSESLVEYREKADIDEGKNEKEKTSYIKPTPTIKSCEYQNMCRRFIATLGLPEGYFNPDHDRCFCDMCHKIRGDEPYHCKGDTRRESALPFGWCKLALRIPLKAEALHVNEKWHIAYCGSESHILRRILDTGNLSACDANSLTGQSRMQYLHRFDEKSKPEEQEGIKPILLSPNIRNARNLCNSSPCSFKDARTRRQHNVWVAVQVFIKPGSYKVGTRGLSGNEQTNTAKFNTDSEWTTKENGATVLSALMVKIE